MRAQGSAVETRHNGARHQRGLSALRSLVGIGHQRNTALLRGVDCRAGPTSSSPSNGSHRSKVVCIGEALFDLISEQPGLSREQVTKWAPYAGGAPCNVATALAKLGLQDVVFVTALGRDAMGDQLYEIIKSSGVHLHGIQRRPEPTRDVYVVRDTKGDREFAGFGQDTNTYSDCFLDEKQLPEEDIKNAAVLVTGTLGLAYPSSRAAMHKAVDLAKSNGCEVLVDVNWRRVFWPSDDGEAKVRIAEYLQEADLIKLSDADMEWLHGINLVTALLNPCTVAEQYPNAKGVLVTAGEEGAAYCFPAAGAADGPRPSNSAAGGKLSGYIPVFKVGTVDTTGAGDVFAAGFIYKLIQHGGLDALRSDPSAVKQAVVFASAVGALTTTRKGAIGAQPSLEESNKLFDTAKAWYNFW